MKCINRLKGNKGSVAILSAFLFAVMCGFCAFAIDYGMVVIEKQKLQTAIDSAALAAAQDLPDTVKAVDTANQYIVLNGFSPSDISIFFTDSLSTININSSKKIEFVFAKIIGLDSTTVHPYAAASIEPIGAAFNYALFSGSKNTTLVLNGSGQYVKGSSHTNRNFVANGSRIEITDACEAMTTITTNGSNIVIGSRLPNSAYVDMPDFSDTIKQQAQEAGRYYNGDKVFNCSSLNADEPIYVNGNLTVNGSRFSGKGCILVTGSITFNGSNLNAATSDAVCFYSKSGNITVNGSSAVFDGILYAPEGNITMNGSNQTVNGRVIGNTVTINGSGLNIISGTNELKSLPSSTAKLIK